MNGDGAAEAGAIRASLANCPTAPACLTAGKYFAIVSDVGWLYLGDRYEVMWGSPFGNIRLFASAEDAEEVIRWCPGDAPARNTRIVTVVIHG